MPELDFAAVGATVERFAAAPLIRLDVRVSSRDPSARIRSVMLQCQVRIETARREYDPPEQRRLVDLFGEPDRWPRTLQRTPWAHTNALVPAFEGSRVVGLPLPCTFDFDVAATKLPRPRLGGEIPLVLLFAGTVFYDGGEGESLRMAQIASTGEVR